MNVHGSDGEMTYASINIGSIEHRKLFCKVQNQIHVPQLINITCWASLMAAEYMRLLLVNGLNHPLATGRYRTHAL